MIARRTTSKSKVTVIDPQKSDKEKSGGSQLISGLMISMSYVNADTRRRKAAFAVGFVTVVIVVYLISILQNSIAKSSVIFVKLAEDTMGEIDLQWTPAVTNQSTTISLNTTDIERKLQISSVRSSQTSGYHITSNNTYINGTSPRWVMFGRIINRDDPAKNTSGILLIIDTEKEAEIGIGRGWGHRPLGEGEIHIKDTLLRALGLRADRGDKVILSVDLSTLSKIASGGGGGVGGDSTNSTSNSTSSSSVFGQDFLKTLFVGAGLELNKTYYINVTNIASQSGIVLPPPLDRALGEVPLTGQQIYDIFFSPVGGAFSNLKIESEYSIVDSIDYPRGKYPTALGNVVVMDSTHVMKAVAESLTRDVQVAFLLQVLGIRTNLINSIRNFKLEENALTVVAQLKTRLPTYAGSDKDMEKNLIDITNGLADYLQVSYPASKAFPLVSTISASAFIRLFLDQIFFAVLIMLGVLCTLLIYSLLLAGVEEKTYEYGMLRALGMKKVSLFQVITAQAMYFAIPGIALGMALSCITNIAVEFGIASFIIVTPTYTYTAEAILIPIALGIFIPLFSNAIPIRSALSRTLRDSLDIYHQTANETTVRMIKLAELGLEPWQTAVSLLLVVMGFVVYYIVPLAFTYSNLPLFFFILNAILLGMLFGLCMVAVVLQPILERAVLYCVLWGPETRLANLIRKNLSSHRRRSSKTFLMFVLAIAFIIFAGVSFSLQAKSIVQNVESLIGADVVIQSTSFNNYPLPENNINTFLNGEVSKGTVANFGFITFALAAYKFVDTARISNLAYYPNTRVEVYGVPQNYLDVAYSTYYLYKEIDTNPAFVYRRTEQGALDAINSLYVDAGKARVAMDRPGYYPSVVFSGRRIGSNINDTLNFDPSEKYRSYIDVIISEAMRDTVSVSTKVPLQMKVRAVNPKTGATYSNDYIAKARAMVYKVPGFFFSSYGLSASGSPLLVSYDQYKRILDKTAAVTGTAPADYDGSLYKEKLYIKLKATLTAEERQDVINGVRSLLDPDYTFVTDVRDLVSSTSLAINMLLIFFNGIATIAILLCFFILWLSFTANVRENSWEFGVLRSVGLSVDKLIRAYIYEALCLVLSAFACGVIIGTAIAITLTLQFNLFVELPLEFDFPYWLVASIFAMSLIVSVVGSWVPARTLKKKEIAMVLRGVA